MLYRHPDGHLVPSAPGLLARAFEALRAARRRRLADLDLLALSDHMKRDLGLFDRPASRRAGGKQNAPAGPGRPYD